MKIWERYFFKQSLKTFILFLFCFYGLYVLIDYAHHSGHFRQHGQIAWGEALRFYIYEFIGRMEVLIPFALLIACIKTLCSLNVSNELVALMASGIKLKRLMLPFVLMGLFFTLLIYLSTEMALPSALKKLRRIEAVHSSEKQKKNKHPVIQHLHLEDETLIIFQTYDAAQEFFYDAYWIRNPDDIYRIKYLLPYASVPTGRYVEHLTRKKEGHISIDETFEKKLFPEMHFNQETLIETVTPPDELALSELKKKIPNKQMVNSEKHTQILSAYYYKLAMPWLCLLAIIGPIPFCVQFTRNLQVFFIYAGSIFGLVAFYLIMDSALILGERQVVAPLLAIWTPFAIVFSFFGWRFARLGH